MANTTPIKHREPSIIDSIQKQVTELKEKTTKTLVVQLDEETYNLLHNFCETTGRTKKWVVKTSIREYIEEVTPQNTNIG